MVTIHYKIYQKIQNALNIPLKKVKDNEKFYKQTLRY